MEMQQMPVREMFFYTQSGDLRNMHRDVWRKAKAPVDEKQGRTFQYAMVGDDMILVRGPNLPEEDTVLAKTRFQPGEYRFHLDLHAVRRGNGGSHLINQEDVPAWLADHLPGAEVVDMRSFKCAWRFQPGSTHSAKNMLGGWCLRGTLRVTDTDLFEPVMRNGIGRGKGFGFGMMILFDKEES